ncbi:hypothetical protein DOY81_011305 [Sarcophaga bullata]|nr:hypothetical protein DOY81_011305 [Sarcophaga bullata]
MTFCRFIEFGLLHKSSRAEAIVTTTKSVIQSTHCINNTKAKTRELNKKEWVDYERQSLLKNEETSMYTSASTGVGGATTNPAVNQGDAGVTGQQQPPQQQPSSEVSIYLNHIMIL